MNQAEFYALLAMYQQANPTPAELEAFTEGLVYYATRNELSSGEALQLAIDQLEADQRQEIEAGVSGLQSFMNNFAARVRMRLDEVEWEV